MLESNLQTYDRLLHRLTEGETHPDNAARPQSGILALNGASGAGQSYVMKRVQSLLRARNITLPRIYLLATRSPRPDEGHKNPYIFVREMENGYQDIYHPDVLYRFDEIYYRYESRPGAVNAILLEDMRQALRQRMYLETVIPTLLHIRNTAIGEISPWEERLRIVYLAAPSGAEWLYRLLNRQPDKLTSPEYRTAILGRVDSSIADMELAAAQNIPTVLNRHGQAERAAEEILERWGV